jgi:hypothetical protein
MDRVVDANESVQLSVNLTTLALIYRSGHWSTFLAHTLGEGEGGVPLPGMATMHHHPL